MIQKATRKVLNRTSLEKLLQMWVLKREVYTIEDGEITDAEIEPLEAEV